MYCMEEGACVCVCVCVHVCVCIWGWLGAIHKRQALSFEKGGCVGACLDMQSIKLIVNSYLLSCS